MKDSIYKLNEIDIFNNIYEEIKYDMKEYDLEINFSKISKGTKFDINNFIIIIANSLKDRLNLVNKKMNYFSILDPR